MTIYRGPGTTGSATALNNTSGSQIISVTDNTNAALRITQLGTANALVIEDSTNPDSTPFVVNANGDVGIGTTTPDAKLTINGVTSFADGSASLPSITNIGDLNTGIYFPAADTIAFTEGGVEAMRITSSGNVGIGTVSPAASALLDVQSITKGVRIPNMTTTQKNAIASPATGLMVFDTTLDKMSVYNGVGWTINEGVNVKDFGADNTGAVSAVAAFQAAINSTPNVSSIVVIHVPSGSYLGNMNTGLTYGSRHVIWDEEGRVTYTTASPSTSNDNSTRLNTYRAGDPLRGWLEGRTGFHSGTGKTSPSDFANVRVDRVADYTGTSVVRGVSSAFRVSNTVSATVGTDEQNKPEWAITGVVVNNSLYANAVATTGIATRNVDGAVWGGQFNAIDNASGASLTRNIRGIEVSIQATDDDVNSKRIILNVISHAAVDTVYESDAFVGYGVLVQSATSNLKKAIAVEKAFSSTIDIGVDLSSVDYVSGNAIKLPSNNYIDFNGDSPTDTKIGVRYNQPTGYLEFTNGTSQRVEFLLGAALPRIRLNGVSEIISGSGTPEGVVTSPIGSMFLRTNGGAGSTLYIKESGTGNTGWVAK